MDPLQAKLEVPTEQFRKEMSRTRNTGAALHTSTGSWNRPAYDRNDGDSVTEREKRQAVDFQGRVKPRNMIESDWTTKPDRVAGKKSVSSPVHGLVPGSNPISYCNSNQRPHQASSPPSSLGNYLRNHS